MQTHPGKIVFVDGHTQQVVKEVDAATVPEPQRFAPGSDGKPVPIVRVVAYATEGNRFVREYGPNDELLRSTTMTRGVPS